MAIKRRRTHAELQQRHDLQARNQQHRSGHHHHHQPQNHNHRHHSTSQQQQQHFLQTPSGQEQAAAAQAQGHNQMRDQLQPQQASQTNQQQQQQRQQQQQDDDFIPLPIQTFLWRQTSPFVRPFLGKARELAQIEQRDACKLFERIIITNNIWGQSPSLTDAIASIDRWRLIRVSFPFVLQCTAALLNNKHIKEHNFNRLAGNEAKMMYTLQWILMNASEECADSENEAKSNASHVAMAAATAASLLKPTSASQAAATSGERDNQPSASNAQQQAASVASTSSISTTIGQQQQQQQATTSGHVNHSNNEQRGSSSSCGLGAAVATTSQSVLIPATAVAIGGQPAAVVASQQQALVSSRGQPPPSLQAQSPQQQASLVPGSSSQQQLLAAQASSFPSSYLLPISSIQMFVYYFAPIMDGLKHSDFLSSNQRLEIGAALWEPLFNYQLPDIHCLKALIRPQQQAAGNQFISPSSSSTACNNVASSTTTQVQQKGAQTSAAHQSEPHCLGATTGATTSGADRRRSSSIFNDSAHFGDVFLGGPTPPPPPVIAQQEARAQQAGAARPGAESGELGAAPGKGAPPLSSHMENSLALTRNSHATYLDVAVLRCLFIADWNESAVFWALNYLTNRLGEHMYVQAGRTPTSQPPGGALADEIKRLLKRRTKSLSCISTDDFRRSLTLKRDYQRATAAAGGPSKSRAHKIKIETARRQTTAEQAAEEQQQQRAAAESKRFLRVSTNEEQQPGDTSPGAPPKSPIRRLSFSSGMQTLANQIRKTSKRVKKTNDQQQQQQASVADLNLELTGGEKQQATRYAGGRLARGGRCSSSADDLTSEQVAALAQLQHDSSATPRPIITVATQQQRRRDSQERMQVDESGGSGEQLASSSKRPASPASTCEPPADLRQYLVQSLYARSLRHLERLTRSQTIPRNMHFNAFNDDSASSLPHSSSIQNEQSGAPSSELHGADSYVDERGRIDPLVVLKIVHFISQREGACSLRVCDRLLALTNRLLQINLLTCPTGSTSRASLERLRRDSGHAALLPTRVRDTSAQASSKQLSALQRQLALDQERNQLVHRVLLDIVFRLNHHLGCPNHCGMAAAVDQHQQQQQQHFQQAGHRAKVSSISGKSSLASQDSTTPSKNLRLSLRDCLELLCAHNRSTFTQYVRDVFAERHLAQVVDILHSLLGFCRPDYLAYLRHRVQQAGEAGDKTAGEQAASCSTPSAAAAAAAASQKQSCESVESLIVSNSFKQLITRMASMSKELRLQENTALYCDIRRLINFVRENYAGTFRSIVLSALIDCTKLQNEQRAHQQRLLKQQQRVSGASCTRQAPAASSTQAQSSKLTAVGGRKLIDSAAPLLTRHSSEEESSATIAGDTGAELHRERLSNDTVNEFAGAPTERHRPGSAAAGLFGGTSDSTSETGHHLRHTSVGSQGRPQVPAGSPGNQAAARSNLLASQSKLTTAAQEREQQQSSGILSLSKAKKKLEQVFGGKQQGVLGTQQRSSGTTNPQESSNAELQDHQELDSSRPGSLTGAHTTASTTTAPLSPQVAQQAALAVPATSSTSGALMSVQLIKQNQLIYKAVQVGMANFAFLMDSCLPGDFLDPALLAALLDLRSPIAIRAAIFLECANFVHRCNRGQWPSWMRMQATPAAAAAAYQQQTSAAAHHRASNAGFLGGGGGASLLSAKLRKSSSIQRTARNTTLMYRAAGRAFYAWAEAVGARLEELLQQEAARVGEEEGEVEQQAAKRPASPKPNETATSTIEMECASTWSATSRPQISEAHLTALDFDFLRPTLNNDTSPFVLKMAACQLLFEVTTFLRETYRYLPPTISVHNHQVLAGSKAGDAKLASIYDVSRAVTANRRWSMALSSLGFGQLPATLSALAAGQVAGGGGPSSGSNNLRTSAAISEQPERRISFILHETKDEDGQQDETTGSQSARRPSKCDSLAQVDESSLNGQQQQGDQQQLGDASASSLARKLNPARHLSQSSASSAVVVAAATLLRSSGMMDSQTHRRKSIKLRKSSAKESSSSDKSKAEAQKQAQKQAAAVQQQQQQDFDEELENSSLSDVTMRRTDSVRSRRRVSGISERGSDISPGQPILIQADGAPDAFSGNESAGNGSGEEPTAATNASGLAPNANLSAQQQQQQQPSSTTGMIDLNKFEADESKIMSHMPWFKAISMVNSAIDCSCSHFPACKPSCYKLHQNLCKRLVSFVQTIYQDPTEQSYLASCLERQLANLMAGGGGGGQPEVGGVREPEVARAGSDCSTTTAVDGQQQSATHKQQRRDKNKLAASVKGSRQQLELGTATANGGGADEQQAQISSSSPSKLSGASKKQQRQQRAATKATQSALTSASLVDETISVLRATKARERQQDEPPMIKYLRLNVKSLLHCPMASFLKGAIILPRENFIEMIHFSWNLLLEDDQQLARSAAVCFIVSAIKCPTEASSLLIEELESRDASRKMAAISKFYVVWDARYQCWPRLEDGAFVHFKMAPPSIEFTLPSPKIAQESNPVVDPPWMPRKTSNVEEVTIGQDQTVQKSFVTATKTRRKQQIEIVTRALREKYDKLREDRENYHITSAPVTLYAAFEPTLAGGSGSANQLGDELDSLGPATGSGAGNAAGQVTGQVQAGGNPASSSLNPLSAISNQGGSGGQAGGSAGVAGVTSGGVAGGAGSSAGGMGASGAMSSSSAPMTDEEAQQENRALFQMKTAQALFPTCLCQSAIVMINLLDDPRVTYEGSAVYETASRVIWSCLVEDPALFLRYFFERLTRQNQNTIFQVLRRLIRFMPRLPPQAAYTLYNYLIGFIIYYIRCPFENSQKLIADTLSVLCLVVPSVHGLFLKDLKQILRKEQCDHNLLITANVPSAKKIIIHGSDSSGIPSQFPIDESTQFYHILVDSLEFFGIEKAKQNEYFLIDVRTNLMHNLHAYVRDHYSFRRSQHPQLQLINMDPSKAFDILQRQELVNQFMEFGKVLMSLSIVKSSHMAIQRALFLHEELMKLPTFPRKALETNFSLFRGPLGHQVFSMDRIHKICWVRVIARMFELTSGFFLQLGDIQLFLNAISGIFVLHCEEASVSRLCLATFINATHQFKSIFATDGFMPIMATIVQVYSNHQNNQLLCRSIEFVCKQFYIMHRKPFLLQLFGSVASRLNTAEMLQQNQITSPIGLHHTYSTSNIVSNQHGPAGQREASTSSSSQTGLLNSSTSGANLSARDNNNLQCVSSSQLNDPNRISPSAFFRLLLSLEKAFKDPLDILELVEAEKPLRAVDFCYQQDKEAIEILDIISLCVTVTAYASESPRSTQMLIILESVVPLYMKHLQASTSRKAGQSMGKQAHKDELQKIQNISVCIRTLIVNCEGLTRNFSGPLPSIDFRTSSIRRTNSSAASARQKHQQQQQQNNSPMDIYNDEPSYTGPELVKPSSGFKASKRADLNRGGAGGNASANQGGRQTTFARGAGGKQANQFVNNDETEITRGEFIVPRDTLLNLVAEFLALSTGRLVESAKKYVELHQKHSSYELLDVKSHLRLAEVANSLLKFASTDPSVMACRGLIRYMNEILPNTEWRQEAIRPALIMILKRLDKTFNRIAKKNWVKRSTDWEAAKQLLRGAYLTFIKHPYIVHLPHLKSLISCCQSIILSDGLQSTPASSNLLHGFASAAAAAAAAASANSQQAVNETTGGVPQGVGGGPQALDKSAVTPLASSSSSRLGANLPTTSGAGRLRGSNSSSPTSSAGGHRLATLAAAAAAANVSAAAATGSLVPAHLSQQQPGGQASAGAPPTSGGTPSLAAVTAAATLAERLAASGGASATSGWPGQAIATQGFNSVTIRLIAMQLLQTGDSQTLESFIGNSMNSPEKLESLMLNLIYPMCIRVCSGAREAPKLRVCDIMFILNIVLNMLAPHSASSKSYASTSSSPKATSATDNASQFILSKLTTTIGSTQTGATALGIVAGAAASHSSASAHQVAQHQEAHKIGFLGLKILCVCFESQLASEWIRITRVIRDLALQPNQPAAPLWDFLVFVSTYRFPMFILLLPTIKCQLARRVREERALAAPNDPQASHYERCFRMVEDKIRGSAPTVCRSRSFLFVSLTAELRMLKEQLIARRKQLAEGERSQTTSGGQQTSANAAAGCAGAATAGNASSSSVSSGQQQAGAGSSGVSGTTRAGGEGGACTLNVEQSGSGEHSTGSGGGAYHRLSQAIASFAGGQGGLPGAGLKSSSGAGSSASGGSGSKSPGGSALKNACLAAQLATAAPIGPQLSEAFAAKAGAAGGGGEQQASSSTASSIRLSTAKSREEARKVMNTILRRTSYPHNQANLAVPGQGGQAQGQTQTGESSPTGSAGERKSSHPSAATAGTSGGWSGGAQAANIDLEAGRGQLIMNPALLMAAAFPAPRKSHAEGSGILKQLVQTIDKQNSGKAARQQQQATSQPQVGPQSASSSTTTSSGGQQQQQHSRRISMQTGPRQGSEAERKNS